jgi:hypothetical protein
VGVPRPVRGRPSSGDGPPCGSAAPAWRMSHWDGNVASSAGHHDRPERRRPRPSRAGLGVRADPTAGDDTPLMSSRETFGSLVLAAGGVHLGAWASGARMRPVGSVDPPADGAGPAPRPGLPEPRCGSQQRCSERGPSRRSSPFRVGISPLSWAAPSAEVRPTHRLDVAFHGRFIGGGAQSTWFRRHRGGPISGEASTVSSVEGALPQVPGGGTDVRLRGRTRWHLGPGVSILQRDFDRLARTTTSCSKASSRLATRLGPGRHRWRRPRSSWGRSS